MVSKGAAVTIQDGGGGSGNCDHHHQLHRVSRAERRSVLAVVPTLAPIWLPHWPAWMWTISLMLRLTW